MYLQRRNILLENKYLLWKIEAFLLSIDWRMHVEKFTSQNPDQINRHQNFFWNPFWLKRAFFSIPLYWCTHMHTVKTDLTEDCGRNLTIYRVRVCSLKKGLIDLSINIILHCCELKAWHRYTFIDKVFAVSMADRKRLKLTFYLN